MDIRGHKYSWNHQSEAVSCYSVRQNKFLLGVDQETQEIEGAKITSTEGVPMWVSSDLFVCLLVLGLFIGIGVSGSRSEFRHWVKRLSERYFRDYKQESNAPDE